jgi:hypothetical protein
VGPTVDVPLASQPPGPPRNYSTTVNVPAGLDAGTYKIVTLLNYSMLGDPQEMAAFHEGPIVQLYEP